MSRFEIVTALMDQAKATAYRPGSNDCFFLALRVVDALTGTNHVKAFSGAYRTLPGAHVALKRRGHASVVTLLETILSPIGWGSARVGDIAVIDEMGVEHTAIHGGGAWHSITADGPRTWALASAKQAFKV